VKAILMTATGKPEVLEVGEMPEPTIEKPTEMLVRLKAAGVNPVDTKLRSKGTFYPDNQQAILGCDGAGIIEAVGTNVSKFKVGDEVYFCEVRKIAIKPNSTNKQKLLNTQLVS
jgi:NADPH2:quinone reductase